MDPEPEMITVTVPTQTLSQDRPVEERELADQVKGPAPGKTDQALSEERSYIETVIEGDTLTHGVKPHS